MADLRSLISEGRRLIAEATKGPWEEGGPWPSISVIYQTDAGCCYGPDGGEPPEYDAVCSIWQAVDHTGRMLPEHPDRARHLADASLIVLAVNSLPQLLAVAEAAELAAQDLGNVLYNIETGERRAAEEQATEIRARLDAALRGEVKHG